MSNDAADDQVIDPVVETIEKPWWLSRGIIGGLVAVLGGLLPLAGYSISAEDQAQLTDLVCAAVSVAGGVLAVIGRAKANSQIKSRKK